LAARRIQARSAAQATIDIATGHRREQRQPYRLRGFDRKIPPTVCTGSPCE
jgi:hypothetical protein